ncbi:MAG: hypothetical protein L7U72_07415 [Rubripirellula sp.]|nr:hypothetical protein [Rubripirellula sp.]
MNAAELTHSQIKQLADIGQLLVDQQRAKVIVPPQSNSTGFWFGGGNMTQDAQGVLWLIGRYRNHGDSRTGLHLGERGLELAIFRSDDQGKSFEKALSLPKAKLNIGDREVLSIEGAALRFDQSQVEVFVSTEKSGINYPGELANFLKPGTGVWTIDRLRADSVDQLADVEPETMLSTTSPEFIHIKDPFLAEHRGVAQLMFCSHPYCWTSSNTGRTPIGSCGTRNDGEASDKEVNFAFFPRGFTWDVAMTRGTAVLGLPRAGSLSEQSVSLFFYDGGECVRNLEEHSAAIKRPRGYSCEELGGLAYCLDGNLDHPQRISRHSPAFISPWGTGCSRYVDVLDAGDDYYVTWQQSQHDLSQPLVLNKVEKKAVIEILERDE